MPIDPSQYKTPLFDAMISLAESRKISFHTPGHKSGKGIATRFVKYVGPNIFSIDLTTLDEVDSLQKPIGVIKEAQELAAKAYGADRSFFLVNGTTAGNHAMVMTACNPGTGILMARNCHKSVIAGAILSRGADAFRIPRHGREAHDVDERDVRRGKGGGGTAPVDKGAGNHVAKLLRHLRRP